MPRDAGCRESISVARPIHCRASRGISTSRYSCPSVAAGSGSAASNLYASFIFAMAAAKSALSAFGAGIESGGIRRFSG